MATINTTSVPSKRLATSINASASTLQLNNIKGWDNNDLTSADFGSLLYAVLRNDTNTAMELVELDPTTIASAPITINKRGLKFTGDLTTEVTANKLTWVKNETIVELGSNPPQLLNHMVRTIGAQTLAGIKTFSSLPAITAGDPVDDNDVARKAYVDATATGTTTVNRLVIAATAGETVADGDLVYFDDVTNNEWMLADADTAAHVENSLLGICQGAGTNGAAITGGVLLFGLDDAQTSLTANAPAYAGNTAGTIVNAAGTKEVVVGIAPSATTLWFYPRYSQEITKDQQDALAGSSGTPSSSNLFITADDVSAAAASGKVVRATGTALPALDGSALTDLVISKSITAGETISGATLPVAVMQNSSDNEFYACDANDNTKYQFRGFAITDGTDGAAMTVQFEGIVSGFTGIEENVWYYVQDDKTIGTTPGTQSIPVGRGVSTTEIQIQRMPLIAVGNATGISQTTAGTVDETVTIGFRPRYIEFDFFLQGHDSTGGLNQYYGCSGMAIAIEGAIKYYRILGGTTGINGGSMSGSNGTYDAAALTTHQPIVASSITVGEGTVNDGDIEITMTLNSISATGFELRFVMVTGGGSATNTAIAVVGYRAYE